MGKILILANSSSGLYGFRNELILEMLKVNQVIASLPDETNNKELLQEGCQIIKTDFNRRGMNPIKDFGLFLTYKNMIKKIKPDVVLTYTIKPNLYGGLVCRLMGIPYICNITGLGTALQRDNILSKLLLFLYRISTSKARCIFFQNRENMEFLKERNVALKNSKLLPGSGVNLAKFEYQPYPSEGNGICFLAVLRIMKDKGIEEFLTAAEYIKDHYHNTSFYLAGEYEAETKDIYQPWVEKLVQKGALHYLGYIDNMKEAMMKSHVIVHPSYHEGMSNVLLEAAACGRPVIASDVPGCRETLQNGLSGNLFTAKDTQSLISAIEIILSYSEQDRGEMGLCGRKYMEEHFDRSIVIKQYMNEIGKIQD